MNTVTDTVYQVHCVNCESVVEAVYGYYDEFTAVVELDTTQFQIDYTATLGELLIATLLSAILLLLLFQWISGVMIQKR